MSMKLKMSAKAIMAAAALAMLASTSAGAVTLKEIKHRGYIRIAVANEIPYGYMDPNGDAKGAGPDVARVIVKKLGLDPKDIQWVVTNFSSLIPGLQANRFDMTAAEMAIRPERCQKVLYSDPNTTYGEGLLVKKGNPDGIHAYTDFAKGDKKVAVMAGADQLQMMQKLGVPEGNIVTIASNSDAISTVSTGRADAYAATGLTASQLADKSNGKLQIVSDFKDPIIDGKETRSWGGFNFNKNSADLQKAFDKELDAFKKTDEWKKILQGYGFTPTDIAQSTAKTTKQLCSEK
ncbi:MAG TPA: ectoine/hydroxyectoine ABC transporter substrate-binding protein EhuB [Rhizobiaceae bacterium]|nr:ectoine/hydroxyectoine ABC transporter substrate-binding protein EhuB [Rhizobiaceae bacterium]